MLTTILASCSSYYYYQMNEATGDQFLTCFSFTLYACTMDEGISKDCLLWQTLEEAGTTIMLKSTNTKKIVTEISMEY